MAIATANRVIIERCLAFGFKVNTCNKQRMNCMHIAAKVGDYNIAVKVLEQGRSEVDDGMSREFIDLSSHDRSTPLYLASEIGNERIMQLLLDK